MAKKPNDQLQASERFHFATTQWSMVLCAGGQEQHAAHIALEQLCQRYWLPLHAYVRRRITNVEDARDLTQAFFTHLLEKNTVSHAMPERGRFRSFLLTAVKHFLINDHERQQAQKRCGGMKRLALDFESGESRLSIEPAHEETPERIFERQWVLTLLETVMRRLQAEFGASGKSKQYELLQGAITAGENLDYAYLAGELQSTAAAVRQMATRLRKRYRELLREEVANTVDDPSEVDEEIRGLFRAFQ